MENSCNPGCNSADRLVEIPYEELRRLVRDSERFAIAKETFNLFQNTYDLEKALKPILGNAPKEDPDE